jgi:hypothetical protein
MTADPEDVFGPKVAVPAAPEPAVRPRQTDLRPLSEIQAELREETAARGRGHFRKRRSG